MIHKGGTKKHPLYNTYCNMISRCRNKNRWNYKFYGGKDIKVCDRWAGENGFVYFTEDMGERPDNYQLDRINNDGDYELSNCRWVNKYIQMANTSTNNRIVGVGWHKQRKKWRARIKVNNKDISLGLFNSFENAVEARKGAEKIYVL